MATYVTLQQNSEIYPALNTAHTHTHTGHEALQVVVLFQPPNETNEQILPTWTPGWRWVITDFASLWLDAIAIMQVHGWAWKIWIQNSWMCDQTPGKDVTLKSKLLWHSIEKIRSLEAIDRWSSNIGLLTLSHDVVQYWQAKLRESIDRGRKDFDSSSTTKHRRSLESRRWVFFYKKKQGRLAHCDGFRSSRLNPVTCID